MVNKIIAGGSMTFPASVKKCHCGKSDARRGDLLTVRNDVYTSGLFR